MRYTRKTLLLLGMVLISILFLAGCSVAQSFMPTATPTYTVTPAPTSTPAPTATPTEIPFFLDATVMSFDQKAPILLYHRFIPDEDTKDATTFIYLSEFRRQLQALYDNGYSLVPLSSWIDGTYVVPPGRKPLVITMDDFWFADQIYITEEGIPSKFSGIGVMWQFAQENPDFGFSAAGFSNMGDKYYGDRQIGSHFFFSEDMDAMWRKLGNTMAWAIENNVSPYNHLLTHPDLSRTSDPDIQFEIEENDRLTRFYLTLVGREDLIPRLRNMIALPFGEWPATQSGMKVLRNYRNQEGNPVEAIFEAYLLADKQLTPSVYSGDFDPMNVTRITASAYMIEWVVSQAGELPSAEVCQLGPMREDQSSDREVIQGFIANAVSSGACPEGIYHLNDMIFLARQGSVTPHELSK